MLRRAVFRFLLISSLFYLFLVAPSFAQEIDGGPWFHELRETEIGIVPWGEEVYDNEPWTCEQYRDVRVANMGQGYCLYSYYDCIRCFNRLGEVVSEELERHRVGLGATRTRPSRNRPWHRHREDRDPQFGWGSDSVQNPAEKSHLAANFRTVVPV